MFCLSRLRSSLPFAVSMILLTAACGDSATGPGAVFIVIVDPVAVTLHPGATRMLTATPLDAHGAQVPNKIIVWTTSDTAVATVSAAGFVTAKAVGGVTITATSDGVYGVAGITVTITPVASVSVSPDSAFLSAGDTVRLVATARDSANGVLLGRPATWISSDPIKATVSGSGLVTAIDSGAVSIRAVIEGLEDTISATITLAASVTIVPGNVSVMTDSTQQLLAVVQRANGDTLFGYPVFWTSDDKAVALVGQDGVVLGVSAGTAHISATSDRITGQALVTVATAVAAQRRLPP